MNEDSKISGNSKQARNISHKDPRIVLQRPKETQRKAERKMETKARRSFFHWTLLALVQWAAILGTSLGVAFLYVAESFLAAKLVLFAANIDPSLDLNDEEGNVDLMEDMRIIYLIFVAVCFGTAFIILILLCCFIGLVSKQCSSLALRKRLQKEMDHKIMR